MGGTLTSNKALSIVERLRAQKQGGVATAAAPSAPTRTAQAVRTAEGATSYTWDAETKELTQGVNSAVSYLGVTILDENLYRSAIKCDILEGPSGPRSRTGALQADLRRK